MNPNPEGPPQPKSWFSRNWKWLVPVGCVLPMLCCISFAAVTYFGASKMIEGSPAFVTALGKAANNDEVKATLGTPLKPGLGLNGEVKDSNGEGLANFTIPLEGPKGSGTLRVKGTSHDGQWTFDLMQVETGGKVIDLMVDERPVLQPKKGHEPSDEPPADQLPPDDDGEPADPE